MFAIVFLDACAVLWICPYNYLSFRSKCTCSTVVRAWTLSHWCRVWMMLNWWHNWFRGILITNCHIIAHMQFHLHGLWHCCRSRLFPYERMKSFTTSAKCKHRGQFKMRTPMHASIPHRSGLFENAYGKKIAIRQNNYLSFEMWIQSKCSLHGFFTSEFCVGDGYIWSDISASIHRNSCSSNAKNGDHVEHRWNVVSKPTIQALHCS